MLTNEWILFFLKTMGLYWQKTTLNGQAKTLQWMVDFCQSAPVALYCLNPEGILEVVEGEQGGISKSLTGSSFMETVAQEWPSLQMTMLQALEGRSGLWESDGYRGYAHCLMPFRYQTSQVQLVWGIAYPLAQKKVVEVKVQQLCRELLLQEDKEKQLALFEENLTAAERENTMLWSLFHHMHDGFALIEFQTDAQGQRQYRYLAANPAFEELVGYQSRELIGGIWQPIGTDIKTYWREAYQKALQSGQIQRFEHYEARTERYYSVKSYIPGPDQFAILMLDITEEKNNAELIRHLAYHDSLTGLANRLHFRETLKQEMLQTPSLAIMFLDLDDFKRVNDTFDHSVGDLYLQTIGQRLQATAPPGAFIARMGGDEFVVLLAAPQEQAALAAQAETFLSALRQPWQFGGREFQPGISIGVAVYPQDGFDVDSLVKAADMAMYAAKHEGGNTVCFYHAAMQAAMLARLALEDALRLAVERNELVLHYQPQVNSKRELIGVEALLRWQHPERGLLYPGDFIETAEQAGLMPQIGAWVLREACRQNAAWQHAGYKPILLAVNVSLAQFQHADFLRQVQAVLAETKLAPNWLELEITETMAMTNTKTTAILTKALAAMGIRQAVDDFGTGYSSLKYLKSFQLDTLKIDKSFIQDIERDADSEAIVKTIMALAENLGLSVVAEGVENQVQYEYLQQLGCVKMQGYYFSRPVPPAMIEELLEQKER